MQKTWMTHHKEVITKQGAVKRVLKGFGQCRTIAVPCCGPTQLIFPTEQTNKYVLNSL